MTLDPTDVRLSVLSAAAREEAPDVGLLNEVGFLDSADLLIALRIAKLAGEPLDSTPTLALALALRQVREGSTALDLASAGSLRPRYEEESDGGHARDDENDAENTTTSDVDGANDANLANNDTPPTTPPTLATLIDLPDPEEWLGAVTRSALAAQGVLRVEFGLVYLDRYHADERLIAERLLTRAANPPTSLPLAAAESALAGRQFDDAQRAAVESVLTRPTTVLTGGPGMGKTHTIAGVITAVRAADPDARIALAAPTGKAAARMSESLRSQLTDTSAGTSPGVTPPRNQASPMAAPSTAPDSAITLHRLLGSVWGTSQRFKHNARNPLPHDLVVVDEASMVSLSMTARLLEALPPSARLLLVGDPDQLASVEAGSVLGDLVEGLGPERSVIRLTKDHRLDAGRVALAQAFREGDPDAVLSALDNPAAGVTFVESEEPDEAVLDGVHAHARALRAAAVSGDAEAALHTLNEQRLLCAHRAGPVGTRRWNRIVEQGLAEIAPEVAYQEMYVGRPLLITRNDYGLGVSNGDTGVIVRRGDEPVAVIETGAGLKEFSPWRLGDVETMHAMTVHKAQGSQAGHVTVLVPPLDSPLLTREMLYTAVTRAQTSLTVVGTREAVRHAVTHPVTRSSGLRHRLARYEHSNERSGPSDFQRVTVIP